MELQIQFNIASLSISPGLTVQAAPQSTATPRRPSDPLPHAPLPNPPPPRQQPVKAELVTTELDDEPQSTPRQQQQSNGLQQAPPPYHIAAARSKQASTFSALHTNTNGNSYNNSNNAANGTVQNNGKGSGNNVNNTNKKANGGQQVRSCNCSSKINVIISAGGGRPGALLREPREHATKKSCRFGLWSHSGTEGQLPQRWHL